MALETERRPSAFHRIELLTLKEPPPIQPSALPFSVDNILRPEFGRRHLPPQPSPSLSVRSSTHRSSEDEEGPSPTKIDPPIPDDPNGPVWPAWVYCTRYSDRPSSGQYNQNLI